MLWILSIIIILYLSSYIFFSKNEVFLKISKWVDIATLVVVSVLVIAWVEIFHYSFYFIIYFLVSIGVIVYLVKKLKKLKIKQKNAEKTIQVLKDEEELLESELEEVKGNNKDTKK